MRSKIFFKRKVFKKSLTLFLGVAMLFSMSTKIAFAGMWGESVAAEIMHETWAELAESFKGEMMSTLKQQALKQITDSVNAETSSYLITDYNDQLGGKVTEETGLVMEEYFNTVDSQDAENGVRSGGMIANARNLTRKAVMADVYSDDDSNSNIEKYIDGDVTKNLFKASKGGGIDALPMAMDENNNTGGMFLKSLTKATNTKDLIKEAKKTEAIAGNGYEGSENIAGSTYAEMAASSKTFNQDLIANAQTIPELAGLMGTEVGMDEFNSQVTDLQKNAKKQAKNQQKSMIRKAARFMYKSSAEVGLGVVPGFTGLAKSYQN